MRRAFFLIILCALAAPAAGDVPCPACADRLGVVVLPLTVDLKRYYGAERDGVLVGTVERGSTADAAGVRVGDVIAEVDGKPVDDAADVGSALAPRRVGDAIAMAVVRNHIPFTLTARLAPQPTPGSVLRGIWTHDVSVAWRELERRIGVGEPHPGKRGD